MPAPITCLIINTLITMSDYSKKEMRYLKNGDKIISYNFETKQNEIDEIENVRFVTHSNIVRYAFEDFEIFTTPDHPFYSEKYGWLSYNPYRTEMYYNDIKEVKYVLFKDETIYFKNINGEKEKVIDVLNYEEKTEMCHIIKLKKNTTFYANDVLTSVENQSI